MGRKLFFDSTTSHGSSNVFDSRKIINTKKNVIGEWRRGSSFIKAIKSIDHQIDVKVFLDTLIQDLKNQICADAIGQIPDRIISKCYLGPEFECHLIDLKSGQIIQHFKFSENIPGMDERVRDMLVNNDDYEFIELYENHHNIVHSDGSITQLNNIKNG